MESVLLLFIYLFLPLIAKFLLEWDRDTYFLEFFVSISHRIYLNKKPPIFIKNILGF